MQHGHEHGAGGDADTLQAVIAHRYDHAGSIEVKTLSVEDPSAIGYIEQSLVNGSVKVLLTR